MRWQKTILALSLFTAIISLPVSMSLCHAALAIYLFAWMSEGRWRQKAELLTSNPLAWGFLVFFILHVIGIGYSEDLANGWFNVEKKLSFFLLPAVFATTLNLDKKTIRFLFKGFIFTCVATTLFCLVMAFYHYQTSQSQINFDNVTLSLYQQLNPDANPFWMFFSYIELASGIGMHPTYLAMYVVFSVLLLIHLYTESVGTLRPLKKMGIILLFFYLEIIVVLLSSRILIFTFTLITLSSLIFVLRSMVVRPMFQALAVLTALAPIIIVLVINPVARYRNLQEPMTYETYASSDTGIYSYSTGIRKSLWVLAVDAINESNLLIGAGTGDVKDVIKKMSAHAGEQNIIHSYDPHNQFLYTQIGLGIAGLTALLVCLYFPFWVAFRQKNYFYMGFILLFTLVCSTESALESQKGIVFFAIFNSLLVFPYANLQCISLKKLSYG